MRVTTKMPASRVIAPTSVPQVFYQGNGVWHVKSQSVALRPAYEVRCTAGVYWSCTCKDFEYRRLDCKHIVAAKEDDDAGELGGPV